MTTVQLRAELFREMNPLLDNESALEKLLAFVKTLLPTKKTKDEAVALSDEERLNAALKMFHSDWGGDGDALEIAADLRRDVENSRTVEAW